MRDENPHGDEDGIDLNNEQLRKLRKIGETQHYRLHGDRKHKNDLTRKLITKTELH